MAQKIKVNVTDATAVNMEINKPKQAGIKLIDAAFEDDESNNLQPVATPAATDEWDIDGDGNIMPKV